MMSTKFLRSRRDLQLEQTRKEVYEVCVYIFSTFENTMYSFAVTVPGRLLLRKMYKSNDNFTTDYMYKATETITALWLLTVADPRFHDRGRRGFWRPDPNIYG